MSPAILRSPCGSQTSSDVSSELSFEPIAICGIACRLPGEATNPRAFWDLLSAGRTAQCKAPGSRFNVEAFYHPKGQDRPGSMMTEGGYFLDEDIREFENSFFGINNLEATYMDPQQRKLLEVVYECLEDAGIPLDQASGSNTGCYVGNFTVDYMVMQLRDPDLTTNATQPSSPAQTSSNPPSSTSQPQNWVFSQRPLPVTPLIHPLMDTAARTASALST
ncbi:hypothetical protein LTS12_029194 [Elasticomyces elasticus]|nr:hypothetical protein LTS12_029194 [Elasticomyces elasticus]